MHLAPFHPLRWTHPALLLLAASAPAHSADTALPPAPDSAPSPARVFSPMDVFQLEMAVDPEVAPGGDRIFYVRRSADVLTDQFRTAIWEIRPDGSEHRPVVESPGLNPALPRVSLDGSRLLFLAVGAGGQTQLFLRWLDTGQTTQLTHGLESPQAPIWSPDGREIAFMMSVPAEKKPPLAELPSPPEGARWAPPPVVIDQLTYRFDGAGFLEPATRHLFVVSAEGGTPRRLTWGDFDFAGPPAWMPDGSALLVSANLHPDWRLTPEETALYRIPATGGAPILLLDQPGSDDSPALSPDGQFIAWLNSSNRKTFYNASILCFARADGSTARPLTASLDRSVNEFLWAGDSRHLLLHFDDRGDTILARVDLEGRLQRLAQGLGGASHGRPYGEAHFSHHDGLTAFNVTHINQPAELAVLPPDGPPRTLTRLNHDLFSQLALPVSQEISVTSRADGLPVQGWLLLPPAFDPGKPHPLILEIHGGPVANYGPRFAAEFQLFAAAGYVVLYGNPRGSDSYGDDFANRIHHRYPGQDYDDLMSLVDAALERGFVDPANLFVTGGSGGGVLTAWIVGQTDRFRAAGVVKPVINWASFVLTADAYPYFFRYWFPAPPWEDPLHYWQRSPLSLVDRVKTPTLLMTGEVDYRTPMSETEQYYQALKLRQVDTVLVRVPDAPHFIASRPSHLNAKALTLLGWFEQYRHRAAPGR